MRIRIQAVYELDVSLAFVASPIPHYELAVFTPYAQTDSYWISDTLTAHTRFEQLCNRLYNIGVMDYYNAFKEAELQLMILCSDQISAVWDSWQEYTFDVCEAFYCLEADFNVSGCIQERPHTRTKRESVGVQLARLEFKPSPFLATHTLTKQGKVVYIHYAKKWGLPL